MTKAQRAKVKELEREIYALYGRIQSARYKQYFLHSTGYTPEERKRLCATHARPPRC